jgi:hypothetical protein
MNQDHRAQGAVPGNVAHAPGISSVCFVEFILENVSILIVRSKRVNGIGAGLKKLFCFLKALGLGRLTG